MRIVCDNCATKYSISDDKVRGKLFKIRCKVCSHVIVVRGVSENVDAELEDEKTKVYDYGDSDGPEAPGASDDQDWFFVLDGQQAGPLNSMEVEERVLNSEIVADTYMWRDGMDDWIHFETIPEFAHLVSMLGGRAHEPSGSPVAAFGGAAASGEHAQAPESSSSIFSGDDQNIPHYGAPDESTRVGAGAAEAPADNGPMFPASESTEPNRANDIFASSPSDPASSSFGGGLLGGGLSSGGGLSGGGGLSSGGGLVSGGGLASGGGGLAAALAASPPADSDPGVSSLVGARNENSVLFSLDTLMGAESSSSSGSNGADDAGNSEGSGLIDIKALADAQSGVGADPLGGAVGGHSTQMAPAVMPMGRRQSNTTLYAALGVGGLVIVGLVVGIIVALGGNDSNEANAVVQPVVEQLEPEAETPVETEPEPVAEVVPDPVVQPDPVIVGPVTEHVVAATTGGLQLALYIPTRAQNAVDEIQAAAQQAARSDRHRNRDRTRSRDRDRSNTTNENTSSRNRDTSNTEGEPRASRSEGTDDAVGDALSRIRSNRGDDDSSSNRDDDNTSSREAEPEPPDDDLPEQLRDTDISRTIRRARRRLAACREDAGLADGEVLNVAVAMTIGGDGRVASARPEDSGPGTDCVISVIRDIRFPEFSGSAMSFTYPVRIR